MSEKENSSLVHKSFHNQIVGDLKKKIADMGSLLETIMVMPSTPQEVVDEIESVLESE